MGIVGGEKEEGREGEEDDDDGKEMRGRKEDGKKRKYWAFSRKFTTVRTRKLSGIEKTHKTECVTEKVKSVATLCRKLT